jgi:hypothetical protein
METYIVSNVAGHRDNSLLMDSRPLLDSLLVDVTRETRRMRSRSGK